jgi:hypothetical protein
VVVAVVLVVAVPYSSLDLPFSFLCACVELAISRAVGWKRAEEKGRWKKKQTKKILNSLSLYFPTAPPQNPFAAAHSAASATPAAYTLGSTAGVRFSTSFCHSQGVKGKGEPANLPG